MSSRPQAGSPAAVSVRGLRKTYGPLVAVEDLDLEISEGEMVAIVGPNGAGKTSIVEVLEGYRRADAGVVRVLGLNPVSEARRLRPQLGLMLQEGGIYPTLRVSETMTLFASFFAHPFEPREMLERVGLAERAGTRFRQLSGGEKQRLSLGLALVGRPRLLFLDEPTAGMDPRARLITWDLIAEARAAGTTVVLTTHALEEAERLADRVAVLSRGRLVAFDAPARLRSGVGAQQLELELDREAGPELLSRLRSLAGVEELSELGRARYRIRSRAPGETAAELTRELSRPGPQLLLLRVGRSSLEDVFLDLTEERP